MVIVLYQKKDGKSNMIKYESYTLNEARLNYATIENELIGIIFVFEKFCTY